jgi:hypothetical protein
LDIQEQERKAAKMKKCKYIELITLYFDRELADKEDIAFAERHLSTCKTCEEWYNYLKKLDTSLRSGEVLTPPSTIFANVLNRLEEYENAGLEKFSFIKWWRYTLIPAAALILCVFAYTLLTKPREIVVKFELHENDLPTKVTSVALVGDFNNWEMENLKYAAHERKWSLKKRLKPGRYHYMFVINGTVWISDPNAREYIEDGYGNKNSIIDSNIM